jgi:hypothetical protein
VHRALSGISLAAAEGFTAEGAANLVERDGQNQN